jgi:glycopeptide antibiotics resistance protein
VSGADPAVPDGGGRHRTVVRGLALLATATLALLLLWPDGEAVRQVLLRVYLFGLARGVPPRIGPEVYATVLNVIVFVPLGWIGVDLLRRRASTVALSLLALSVGVELVQALPALGRAPSLLDVACNAAGGLIGALLGSVVVRRRHQGQHTGVHETTDERHDGGLDGRG